VAGPERAEVGLEQGFGPDLEGELIAADLDNGQTGPVDGDALAEDELRAHRIADDEPAARTGLLGAFNGAQRFNQSGKHVGWVNVWRSSPLFQVGPGPNPVPKLFELHADV